MNDCAECLAIVRALAGIAPWSSRGGFMYDWLECDLCGARFKDYEPPAEHRAECLWTRAVAHARTHCAHGTVMDSDPPICAACGEVLT